VWKVDTTKLYFVTEEMHLKNKVIRSREYKDLSDRENENKQQ
jgi:hypothetical protein